jgi:hypothetical protein
MTVMAFRLSSALLAMLVCVPVQATVLATSTRVLSIDATGLLPLNDAGKTALAFKTSADRQKVVITYNANCYTNGYVKIRITVDGANTNPNSTGIIFCGVNNDGSWSTVSASRQAVYTVPRKGTHYLSITVTQDGGDFFNIYNSSVSVMK